MNLHTSDLQLINDALLDAFGPDSLSILLKNRLGVRISDITVSADFLTTVSNVIVWAEQHDQVDVLVAAAKSEVPTNRKLKALPDTFADVGHIPVSRQHEERILLEQELGQHKRNLYRLRVKAAKFGTLYVPISILSQIDDELHAIEQVEAKLRSSKVAEDYD